MKKLLTILLLALLTQFAFAQKSTSFWGVEYGMSKNAVEKKLRSERKISRNYELSAIDRLVYTDVKFSGEYATITMEFDESKFFRASVIIIPSQPMGVFGLYDDMKSKLGDAYGKPISESSVVEDSFMDFDGSVIEAVMEGRVNYSAAWEYKVGEELNSVSVFIVSPAYVCIQYSNVVIDKAKREKEIKEL